MKKQQKQEAQFALQNISNSTLTQAEKYAKGYCKTCDGPRHRETQNDCERCDGELCWMQDD
jgi:hypothetical protein